MPIREILQSSEPVLNRVLTKMITAYQTDKPEDPNSITLFKNKWKILMTYIKTIQTWTLGKQHSTYYFYNEKEKELSLKVWD